VTAAAERSGAVTYAFAGVVYVSLTNRSNCVLTMLEANGPGFEFPPGTGFSPLPAGYEPTGAEAAAAALGACQMLDLEAAGSDDGGTTNAREIVYAGLGEPLMRLPALCEAVGLLAAAEQVGEQRLNTNGLLGGAGGSGSGAAVGGASAAEAAQMLADAGLSSACVQIQTADPNQHSELMRPLPSPPAASKGLGLGLDDAVEFAAQLLRAGVAVECSVVARPGVDLSLAEALAIQLGATFKARPHFP
jgi:hypothetical protein